MNANDTDLLAQPTSERIVSAKASRPSPAVLRRQPPGSITLPDWAPWAVLGGLVTFGILGGTGLLPLTIPGLGQSKAAAARTRALVPEPHAPTPASSAKAIPDAEERISVLQLVVTYEGTMLAKSQKIQRSAAEAKARALEVLTRARKGDDFQELVEEYTDQPAIAGQKGAILGFKRSQALPDFSNAAFALEVGQVSDIVETKFGYHVIKRTK